jgi:hypothetical protein
MKRTIGGARRWLEDNARFLNPPTYRQMEGEIREASAQALQLATRTVDNYTNDVLGQREAELRELVGIRDALLALAEQGASGTLSARELNEQLAGIRRGLQQSDRHIGDVDRITGLVETIEQDPEGWVDATYYSKYPHMTPEFDF